MGFALPLLSSRKRETPVGFHKLCPLSSPACGSERSRRLGEAAGVGMTRRGRRRRGRGFGIPPSARAGSWAFGVAEGCALNDNQKSGGWKRTEGGVPARFGAQARGLSADGQREKVLRRASGRPLRSLRGRLPRAGRGGARTGRSRDRNGAAHGRRRCRTLR